MFTSAAQQHNQKNTIVKEGTRFNITSTLLRHVIELTWNMYIYLYMDRGQSLRQKSRVSLTQTSTSVAISLINF
jgi:hypothetical protein